MAGHLSAEYSLQSDRWQRDQEHRQLAVDLIQEEVNELAEAVEKVDPVETLDALSDILFTLMGLAAKSGLDVALEDAFKEVIRSNMTKVTGERVILPSGKIGKPEGYEPPDIRSIVEKYREEGLL